MSTTAPVILRRAEGACPEAGDPSLSGCMLVVFGCVIIKIRYPIRVRLKSISRKSR
jgi:hypothetical protein